MTPALPDRVRRTLEVYGMLGGGEHILVGFSGGPDSSLLLHLLLTFAEHLSLRLTLAHIHHGLRGEEADADARFVRSRARALRLPLVEERVEAARRAREEGLSIEEAARAERYSFFRRACARTGADRIALGHTASDRVETVLMNLVRGTGLRGLCGIPPVREEGSARVIRPLIDLWREEVLSYLRREKIPWREDTTNRNLAFRRNWIRHRLIPALEEMNPSVGDAILRLSETASGLQEWISAAAVREAGGVLREGEEGVVLDLDALHRLPRPLAVEVLRAAAARASHGRWIPEAQHLSLLLSASLERRGSSVLHLPGGIRFLREYGRGLLKRGAERPPSFDRALDVPGTTVLDEAGIEVRIERLPVYSPSPPSPATLGKAWSAGGEKSFAVDLDGTVGEGPLRVRSVRPGDAYTPAGSPGRRKVQDILVDEKVPRRLRPRIPLLVCGGEIVWLAGYRPSGRFIPGPQSGTVLRVRVRVT